VLDSCGSGWGPVAGTCVLNTTSYYKSVSLIKLYVAWFPYLELIYRYLQKLDAIRRLKTMYNNIVRKISWYATCTLISYSTHARTRTPLRIHVCILLPFEKVNQSHYRSRQTLRVPGG
jgi:hypothetical protein